MEYGAIPLLVLGMLSFMFWRTAKHMRRDRVYRERHETRGKHALRPIQRARLVLTRAFRPPKEEPPWQSQLEQSLDRAPVEPPPRP